MNIAKKNIDIEIKQEKKTLLYVILIFTIAIFTPETFISSNTVKVFLIIITNILFLNYYILEKKKIIFNKIEFMWLMFLIYLTLSVLLQTHVLGYLYIDLIVYFNILLFFVLVKVDVSYYKVAMSTMSFLAIIYALGSMLQFINISLYSRLILPFFEPIVQESVMNQYNEGNGAYAGISTQTAYIAGYMVYGIGLLIINFKSKKNLFNRILSVIALLLLFIALLMAGKRAHLIFLILALIITYLLSTEIKRFFIQILKLTMSGIAIIIFSVISFNIFKVTFETPLIGRIYYKMSKTLEGIKVGEDITSGRTLLYDYAFKLFNESPILGIGWRKYSQSSSGVLGNDFGSEPHNIYLQLLTELGIIGFILFIIPLLYNLIKTTQILLKADILFQKDMRWKTAVQFSFFIQMFFILYGITGNLLTDHLYVLMWAFSVTITLSSMKYIKHTHKKHYKENTKSSKSKGNKTLNS